MSTYSNPDLEVKKCNRVQSISPLKIGNQLPQSFIGGRGEWMVQSLKYIAQQWQINKHALLKGRGLRAAAQGELCMWLWECIGTVDKAAGIFALTKDGSHKKVKNTGETGKNAWH